MTLDLDTETLVHLDTIYVEFEGQRHRPKLKVIAISAMVDVPWLKSRPELETANQ